jgi:Ca2+-binding RTX toxin-like protein
MMRTLSNSPAMARVVNNDMIARVVNNDMIARVVNNDNAAPDNTNTTNSMEVGDTFSGRLNRAGDTDWIALDLTAGQTVRIDLTGDSGSGGLGDPFLALHGPDGSQLTTNDDRAAGNFDSTIFYTAAEAGTYYIVADSYENSESGSYRVSVSAYTIPDFDPLDTIDWGSRVPGTSSSGGTISYYFAPSGHRADGVTSEGWNSYEQGQMEQAMATIEAVSGLRFQRVSSAGAADLVLINDRNEIEDLGYFNPPGTSNAGVGVFGADDWDRSPGGDLEQGGFGYVTILHELLHGLGFAHPHDDGGRSTILPMVNSPFGEAGAYDLNQGLYTIMTYNSGYLSGPVGTAAPESGPYGYEGTPMALDIALLQQRYGSNDSHAAGNDTYALPDGNRGGTMWQAIWDTGGTDSLTYGGSRAAVLDLRPATLQDEIGGGGFVSAANGIAGGFTIAAGVVIENASGGSGDDLITGNDADNTLNGNGGHDTMAGGKGDDTLSGAAGHDDLHGNAGADHMTGGEGDDTLRGGTGADTVEAGNGHDQIRGQSNADLLNGGSGHDNIKGGGGNDTLSGEDGDDYLKGGTRKDLIIGGAGADTLLGNSFNDTLQGGSGNDRLLAGGDNDVLEGGAGNDYLKGGDGSDDFVFGSGHGQDRIADFDTAEDTLQLSAALADGRDAAALVAAAQVVSDGVQISLTAHDTILLAGLSDTTGLADAIDIL